MAAWRPAAHLMPNRPYRPAASEEEEEGKAGIYKSSLSEPRRPRRGEPASRADLNLAVPPCREPEQRLTRRMQRRDAARRDLKYFLDTPAPVRDILLGYAATRTRPRSLRSRATVTLHHNPRASPGPGARPERGSSFPGRARAVPGRPRHRAGTRSTFRPPDSSSLAGHSRAPQSRAQSTAWHCGNARRKL